MKGGVSQLYFYLREMWQLKLLLFNMQIRFLKTEWTLISKGLKG